jgi:hypothetical protein
VVNQPRFLGLTPDGRARYACDYEAELLRPLAARGADPDCDDQIDASTDDAEETETGGGIALDGTTLNVWAISGSYKWCGLRFNNGPFPAKGSTISVADFQIYASSASPYNNAAFDTYADDRAAPPTFSSNNGDITGRTRTTHSEPWVEDGLSEWKQSPSIVSVIQELATDYDSTAIVLILKPKTDVTKALGFRSWDAASHALGAKLHLEWTEGGPPVGQPTMRRWGGVPGMVYTGRAGW